jgi:DHA1 family multidrug resistance protein-like MFS transporter
VSRIGPARDLTLGASAPPETQPDEVPSMRPLFLSLTLSSLGIGVSLPVVPLFAVELGAVAFAVGLIVSMRWAARLVADLPVGAASERFGRRRVLVTGIGLVAVSGAVSAAAPDWGWLLAARVMEGVGAGMSTTAGLAAVADVSTPNTRGRLLSSYQAAQRIGFWFGPLIGGSLAASFDLRLALWGYALLATAAILPALAVTESRHHAPVVHGSAVAAFGALARSRDFVLISAVSFGVFFTMTGAQFTALPLFASFELDLGAEFVGWALFLSNTVGFVLLYPSGLISDRYGRRAIIVVLLAATVVGLVLMALAGGATWILLASLAMGGGNALRGPAMQAYVMDAGRGGGHGATAGAFRAIGDLGSTLGPVVASASLAFGYRGFFLVNALLVGIALLLFWRYASARPGEVRSRSLGATAETAQEAGAQQV